MSQLLLVYLYRDRCIVSLVIVVVLENHSCSSLLDQIVCVMDRVSYTPHVTIESLQTLS